MIKNILSQNAFWQVNKAIARATSIEAALLLSDLIDKHTYHSEKNELKERNGAWYFFATADAIELNTTLSYHKQKKVLEVLEQFGLIKTLLMGNPAKLHFSICEREILAVLKAKDAKSVLEKFENKYSKNSKTSIEENGKQVLEKTQNYSINNRDIKNKELKIECEGARTNFSSNLNLSSKKNNDSKADVRKKESYTGPAESNKTENENILFKNSIYANNFELFKNDLISKNKENEMYDLRYYFDTVQDWSESKGEKRANWIATAQRFIARDNDSKKAKFSSNAINKNDNKPIPTATKRGNIVEF